jgi:hypothetical protein
MNSKWSIRSAIVLLAAVAGVANAAGNGSGKIRPGWFTYPGGLVFFFLDGPNDGHANSPCTVIPSRWVIDTNTVDGKIAFAAFMLAYSQDRPVQVSGFDGVACVHGNTEVALAINVY